MLIRLILLLTCVPLVELFVLLQVHGWMAQRLGSTMATMVTIGSILVTGVLGAVLARQQSLSVFRSISQRFRGGGIPGPELVDAALVLVGSALLLTPGFLTDAGGFALLLPPTRKLCRERLVRWFQERIRRGDIRFHGGFSQQGGPRPYDRPDVVDVPPHLDKDVKD
ncbi:phage T7 F exclusion suppressor FxsA [Planctomycetes bacterium Pan216]|uniref:Phage T7 F exclusion suppressor FxsA n=1 Tax=Kolteria novifilia TaxID=2527975 RepID=A0A518B4I5_9BACT|nr:phage T7 F exclusion suppressor FxsA [Planctomycetes bacterium Pan216]